MTNDVPELWPVSDLCPEAVDWLWGSRLARGKLSLLEGDPGLGKSLVSLDLCARLSRGQPFPDGAPGLGPCNSLVLSAEDGPADTVRTRLAALGADLGRVFVLSCGREGETIRLPSQLGRLDAALTGRGIGLIVIDPLLAFLDANVASGNDQNIRQALAPLARLAEHHRCAVWLVRHLNKRGGKPAAYRGGGAIGLLAVCRSAWLIARDPLVSGQCVLAQVKNNLAPPQPSLAYRVEAPSDGAVRVAWLGESPLSADQALAPPRRGRVRAQARALLLSLLRDGPRPARDIWVEGQKHGLIARALQRAREDLSVRSQWAVRDGARLRYWLLPHQQLAPLPSDPAFPLEPWLAPLREKYPPGTPLEEEEP